jgi:hypothetical protein
VGRVGETLVIGPVDRNSVLSLMNTNVFNSRQIGALNLHTYSKLPNPEFIGAYPNYEKHRIGIGSNNPAIA